MIAIMNPVKKKGGIDLLCECLKYLVFMLPETAQVNKYKYRSKILGEVKYA